ncbi:MAG: ABC transporter permease [Acidobacteria bacterium]|nr:ABC transporter permease [Acidobacteriota bacterium]
MNIRESLAQSLDNLAKRKLRALLTMLGIIFGVGAVISMLSIGAGAEDQALQVIRHMGLRNILIEGKEYTVEDLRKVREKSLGLSRRDLQALLAVTPNVARGAGRKTVKAYQVFSEQGKVESRVVAVDAAYLRLKNLTLLDGAFFDGRDEETYAQVCVLGAAAKQGLFGFESTVGKQLKINNVWFAVTGVIADQSLGKDEFEGVRIQNTNNDIFIPLTTALKKIEFKPMESELDGIVLEVADERRTQATAMVVSQMLDKLHNGEADYSLVIPEQLLRQSQQTQRIFNIVMGCIAGISLLVGGIGIMNIMLANVLERTKEIGVRRAIGARRADIRLQFLIEAVTISALGGLLGVALGFAIARLVVYFAGWSTIITPWSVALAVGVSTAVGILFGSYPAVQASRLSPIEALRYE